MPPTARDAEALADFESAVRFNNRSWRAIHNRGVSYAAAGRVAEAMTDFDRTIKLNQSYPNAYFNRGELLYAQGKFEAAIGDYIGSDRLGLARRVDVQQPRPCILPDEAVRRRAARLRPGARLDPHNAATLVNRGDTYLDLARYADAAADYRAAVSANPKLGRAYQAAAWLMATCPDDHYRNEKLAIDAASKAIELDGEDFRNLETLAAAQANAGQFAEAKATQEKAIAKARQARTGDRRKAHGPLSARAGLSRAVTAGADRRQGRRRTGRRREEDIPGEARFGECARGIPTRR